MKYSHLQISNSMRVSRGHNGGFACFSPLIAYHENSISHYCWQFFLNTDSKIYFLPPRQLLASKQCHYSMKMNSERFETCFRWVIHQHLIHFFYCEACKWNWEWSVLKSVYYRCFSFWDLRIGLVNINPFGALNNQIHTVPLTIFKFDLFNCGIDFLVAQSINAAITAADWSVLPYWRYWEFRKWSTLTTAAQNHTTFTLLQWLRQ